ncbi:MAG: AAA family ATPase [Acidobacteria bacterium]|nr:MAG: AAA family ATPase [Acidobacteriota bacterium]
MGFWELLTNSKRGLVQAVVPTRTFEDVILPVATLRSLESALTQIEKHELIFNHWGLGERHTDGLGLAFAFAGPPGTGKTICAEALANALGKKLLIVRYSELESMWVGETGKNVVSLFRAAAEQDAVLFFDEADAIASRRFVSLSYGYEREANAVVNVLLSELEHFPGVTIFATNLAANFDPAFERRVRTHILFELPTAAERELIWKVQLHAERTPLAADVDFRSLGERFAVTGGDIKNAVLKAAQMASLEPGDDLNKQIHQRHFEAGMQEVLAAKRVMEQSLFDGGNGSSAFSGLAPLQNLLKAQEELKAELESFDTRLRSLEENIGHLTGLLVGGRKVQLVLFAIVLILALAALARTFL